LTELSNPRTPYHTQDIVVIPLPRGNAFAANPPSPYHDKDRLTKPGSEEYIDSVVALFSSWGFDFIKLDAFTPGSYSNDLSIDNRPTLSMSKAIAKTGPPYLADSFLAALAGLCPRLARVVERAPH